VHHSSEKIRKKTDFVWLFLIFEIKPNTFKKARFCLAFFVFSKKSQAP